LTREVLAPLRRRLRALAQTSATDSSLLAAVRDGVPEALLQLYGRYGDVVYAVACRVAGPMRAEEVTRKLFLRLWEAPDEVCPTGSSLRGVLLAEAYGQAVQPDPDDDPRQPARPRLDSLAQDQADALKLIIFGGCTYREAAALLAEAEPDLRDRVVLGLLALNRSRRP